MGPLRIEFEDERCVMATVRNVAFIGWRDTPLAMHLSEWQRIGRAIAKTHPGAGACVDIVLRGTPSFSDEVRREAVKLASDTKIFELAWAHAILLDGFGGTAVRAFISTVLLVARPPVPTKVFSDLASAARWIGPRLEPHGWTVRDVEGCAAALREKLERPAR